MKKILSACVVLMGVALSLPAQGFQFTHINNANSNLAYDSIRELFQDSRGYIWIGTYKGLSRFDGIRNSGHGFGRS